MKKDCKYKTLIYSHENGMKDLCGKINREIRNNDLCEICKLYQQINKDKK